MWAGSRSILCCKCEQGPEKEHLLYAKDQQDDAQERGQVQQCQKTSLNKSIDGGISAALNIVRSGQWVTPFVLENSVIWFY